jgi:hypothetical protein
MSGASVVDLLSFTQNSMQTCHLIVPSVADNMKHEVKKVRVHSAVSCVILMQCSQRSVMCHTDAVFTVQCRVILMQCSQRSVMCHTDAVLFWLGGHFVEAEVGGGPHLLK